MIRTYTCDGCGGELVYRAGSDEAKCARCGKAIPISALNVNLEAGKFSGKIGPETQSTAGDGTVTRKCASCGADLPTGDYTAATVCKYCGSPAIVESQIEGDYRPTRVVPFEFDKKEAQKKFMAWSKKGALTPTDFKQNAIMNQLKCVYVPFWLYDYEVNVEMTAEAENKRTEKDGNTEREIVEIYDVTRNTHGKYNQVPVAASNDIPADEMRILEPYDYSKLREFSMPYLAGYQAEKYAKTDVDLRDDLKEDLKKDAIDATEDTITGYNRVTVKDASAVMFNEQTEYVMMPVYTIDYSFKGKKFPIYMNGQTGKIAGALPTSGLKAFLFFVIAVAIVSVICGLISVLLIHKMDFLAAIQKSWIWGIIALIIGGIATLIARGNQSGFGKYSRRKYLEDEKVIVIQGNDRFVSRSVSTKTVDKK